MKVYQARIFIPPGDAPFNGDNWAETAMALIIKPLVQKYEPKWFWFTRYDVSPLLDGGDAEINSVPDFYYTKRKSLRSLRFRFRPKNTAQLEQIKRYGNRLCEQHNCLVTVWCEHPHYDDLGGGRFVNTAGLSPKKQSARRKDVADKLAIMLHGASMMMLENLVVLNDGKWTIAPDETYGDKMVSPHHLICNMTGIFYDDIAMRWASKVKLRNEKWWKILHKIPKRLIMKCVYALMCWHFGTRHWR